MSRPFIRSVTCRGFAALVALAGFAQCAAAEDWVVQKSSGQVWIATTEAKPVALAGDAKLLPGDLVQTGPTGRVLLTRGEERILVAPNSVLSLPKDEPKSGFTTIIQQAGSIAVEVEKKDKLHFEVQTPYLAAVVKGTTFVVTVRNGAAQVDVTSGKVQTINLASGQSSLVLPGQTARVNAGSADILVGGKGALSPIERGPPRPTTLAPVSVPKGGLTAPPKLPGLNVHSAAARGVADPGVVRITHPIGAVKLDAGAATFGLVRGDGASTAAPSSTRATPAATVWSAPADAAGGTVAGSVSPSNGGVGSANAGGNGGNGNGLALGVNAGAGNGSGLGASGPVGNGNGFALGLGNGNNGHHYAYGRFK